MRIKLIYGLFVFWALQIAKTSFAQTSYDSSFRFYYYDQKISMFAQNKTQKPDIVWLGDSITDGGEWAEFFPRKKVLNRGISSDNTFGILYRLEEVTRRNPKKIFLLIGINDIARNIPDTVIIENYRKIIEGVQQKSPQTRLYMQSILPTNNSFTNFKNHQNKTDHIVAINKAMANFCDGKKVIYVNLYDKFTDGEGKLDKKFTNDGLHLLGEGYVNWVNILKNEINH